VEVLKIGGNRLHKVLCNMLNIDWEQALVKTLVPRKQCLF
jgi:hypothetical protein